jgi:small GTP-binding protein
MANVNNEKDVKVILLGESGVGKTCIINRYINNEFQNNVASTLGSAFFLKEIIKGDTKYNVNVWDTTGQERYHSVTNLFINDSHIIILVYSIDSKATFDNLNYWYDTIREKLKGEKYILSVVGSKYDLVDNEVVTEEEGRKFAKEKDAIFKLVSAKEDPDGINKLFDILLDELIEKNILENKTENKCQIKKGDKSKKPKKNPC